jgi:ketosteroid isomerase-like protein
MAPDMIQTIRNGFAAWSRGDLDDTLANLDPEIEFVTSGVFPGLDLVYRGHAGFSKFFDDFRGPWEDISIGAERIVTGKPPLFVMTGRFHARARDGLVVERPVSVVVAMRNGKIRRMQSCATQEEAFVAAGLPPAGPKP